MTRPQAQVSTVPLDNQTVELPGGERVSHFAKDGNLLSYRFEDAKTLYEGFQRGKRESNDGPCLGWRESATGPYNWIKYSQVEERFLNFGAGLAQVGVPPGQETFIGLYGPNCAEWVVTEQSCNAYSRVVVPLYDTLGKDAVTHILNQADIKCVVCNASKLSNLIAQKSDCQQLETIVLFEETVDEALRTSAETEGIKVYSYTEIEEKGRNNPLDLVLPSGDDLSTICYTSGTTGLPKGVMMSHGNIIANASGIYRHLEGGFVLKADDSHISYLPLAHMMERTAQALILMCGARIGFFRGDVKTLVNDIMELKPTMFMSVPRLLNRVYDKVLSGVEGSRIKKWLFDTGYQSKLAEVRNGIVRNNSWWDTLVFRRVQASLGGRVRFIISGSAPISSRVMDFLRVCFGCDVLEGYGQTECTAGATLSTVGDTGTGNVGAVLPCGKVKLIDAPEMKYFAENGEGEVCFKGPCITKGYYKEPEKTAALFDPDGWVKSGDVGKWMPNGTLKIIDRVKHIFKLAQGEYIAPEKIENICIRSCYIAQMFLFGDSLKSSCVAIVVPDEEVLARWAANNGRKDVPFEDLCKDDEIKKMIFEDLKVVGKRDGLNSLEIPKAIKLCHEPFSVENDILTPTFKLKRPQAKNQFMEDILDMYSQLPA